MRFRILTLLTWTSCAAARIAPQSGHHLPNKSFDGVENDKAPRGGLQKLQDSLPLAYAANWIFPALGRQFVVAIDVSHFRWSDVIHTYNPGNSTFTNMQLGAFYDGYISRDPVKSMSEFEAELQATSIFIQSTLSQSFMNHTPYSSTSDRLERRVRSGFGRSHSRRRPPRLQGPQRPAPEQPGPEQPGPEQPGPEQPGPEQPGPENAVPEPPQLDFLYAIARARITHDLSGVILSRMAEETLITGGCQVGFTSLFKLAESTFLTRELSQDKIILLATLGQIVTGTFLSYCRNRAEHGPPLDPMEAAIVRMFSSPPETLLFA